MPRAWAHNLGSASQTPPNSGFASEANDGNKQRHKRFDSQWAVAVVVVAKFFSHAAGFVGSPIPFKEVPFLLKSSRVILD